LNAQCRGDRPQGNELLPEAGDVVADRGVGGIAEVLNRVTDHPVGGQLHDRRKGAADLDKATLVIEDGPCLRLVVDRRNAEVPGSEHVPNVGTLAVAGELGLDHDDRRRIADAEIKLEGLGGRRRGTALPRDPCERAELAIARRECPELDLYGHAVVAPKRVSRPRRVPSSE